MGLEGQRLGIMDAELEWLRKGDLEMHDQGNSQISLASTPLCSKRHWRISRSRRKSATCYWGFLAIVWLAATDYDVRR